MVFSSLTFLFFFLALTVTAYMFVPGRTGKNAVLLVASLVFYAWGEPRLVLLMVLVAAVAYGGGLLIDKLDGEKKPKLRTAVYILTIVLIASNLLYFKYLNFFADNIGALFGKDFGIARIALPIGISFYTFQILSYVIDLYRKNVGVQKNFFNLLLYLCFFPQLIAGPIVRYSTIEDEILNRKENLDDMTYGARRFCLGLAKKVLIANGVASLAEIIYAGNPAVYGTGFYWIAALAYTLQIYFDFSGYSDMAIGLGRIFGFHFLENFDHPYIAVSVTDFWRRWHISLSTWFRDYIYIPLGGNRVSKGRWMVNLFIVWALTGFWHGAEWNFILWGLYYAVLLMIEKLWLGAKLEKLPKIVGWIYTFFIVNIGWVLFNRTDFHELGVTLKTMFTRVPTDFRAAIAADTNVIRGFVFLLLGLVFMFPIGKLFKKVDKSPAGAVLANVFALAIFVLSVIFCVSTKYNPFIYFRF